MALRQHIGLVPQDTGLFSASLRDNIAFGHPDADETLIIDAAKKPKHMISLPPLREDMMPLSVKKACGCQVGNVSALR